MKFLTHLKVLMTLMILTLTLNNFRIAQAALISDNSRLAILPYANKAAISEELSMKDPTIVSEFIIEQILYSGRFKIVERELLHELANEYSVNLGGMVNSLTAVSMGKLLGAQYLVAGSVVGLSTKESGLNYQHSAKGGAGVDVHTVIANITIRFIDLEDGTVVLAASGTGESASTQAEFSLRQETENYFETTITDDSGIEDASEDGELRVVTQKLTIGSEEISLVQVRNALYKATVDAIYNKNYGVIAQIDGKAKRRKV